MPDFRLVIRDGSEEDKILKKIKAITGVKDGKQIIKACIHMAYEHYYKNLELKID